MAKSPTPRISKQRADRMAELAIKAGLICCGFDNAPDVREIDYAGDFKLSPEESAELYALGFFSEIKDGNLFYKHKTVKGYFPPAAWDSNKLNQLIFQIFCDPEKRAKFEAAIHKE